MPASAFSTEALLEAVDRRCTVDGVRRQLMVHRATAWRGLQRAEASGLVERAPIPAGDAWLLTTRGQRKLADYRRTVTDRKAEVSATLSRPGVVAALREALGPPMKRPRGRPRTDGTYQLRLGLDEPANPEEAWWQGEGAWEGPRPPSTTSPEAPVEEDRPVNHSLGELFEVVS